jgi:hypothetical protein
VLIDKVAGRLLRWKGKLLNKTGRLTLVNSVLSSIVLHHMTVFPLSKWAIKQIDKIMRNFLWTGSEKARGGNSLVNWKRIQRPRKLGGLGILELNKFNQALRVRWQWLKWTDANKPWGQMYIPQSRAEDALFRACTAITVGNGQGTKFWLDRWINGQSPKDLAPTLYRLTRHKNITVAQGCHGGKWLTGLQQINTGEEVNQLVLLWSLINQVQLSEQPDSISAGEWRVMVNTSRNQHMKLSS